LKFNKFFVFSIIFALATFAGLELGLNNNVLAQNSNYSDINSQSVDRRIIEKIIIDKFPPEGSFQITSLTIVEDYALVGVADDYTGGASLLKKEQGIWEIVVETGGALGVNDLVSYGVPEAIAEELMPKPPWMH